MQPNDVLSPQEVAAISLGNGKQVHRSILTQPIGDVVVALNDPRDHRIPRWHCRPWRLKNAAASRQCLLWPAAVQHLRLSRRSTKGRKQTWSVWAESGLSLQARTYLLISSKQPFGYPTLLWLLSLEHHSFTLLRRSAFEITDTDERLMAAAAIIGDNKVPVSG